MFIDGRTDCATNGGHWRLPRDFSLLYSRASFFVSLVYCFVNEPHIRSVDPLARQAFISLKQDERAHRFVVRPFCNARLVTRRHEAFSCVRKFLIIYGHSSRCPLWLCTTHFSMTLWPSLKTVHFNGNPFFPFYKESNLKINALFLYLIKVKKRTS